MKAHENEDILASISLGGMARSGRQGGNWAPGSSRTLKPDLELLDPMAIILSIPRTFMGLSLGGAVNPGRDHGVEKSVFINRLNNRPESLKKRE
jgi:hypothetical protein